MDYQASTYCRGSRCSLHVTEHMHTPSVFLCTCVGHFTVTDAWLYTCNARVQTTDVCFCCFRQTEPCPVKVLIGREVCCRLAISVVGACCVRLFDWQISLSMIGYLCCWCWFGWQIMSARLTLAFLFGFIFILFLLGDLFAGIRFFYQPSHTMLLCCLSTHFEVLPL